MGVNLMHFYLSGETLTPKTHQRTGSLPKELDMRAYGKSTRGCLAFLLTQPLRILCVGDLNYLTVIRCLIEVSPKAVGAQACD